MRVNSTLIASLQGSITGGQELEVPEALLPTIALPLPLMGIQLLAGVELRNVPNSIHSFRVINQGNNLTAQSVIIATLDRGVYKIKGHIHAHFVNFVPVSADPFGAVLQLFTPGGAAAVTIALTPLNDSTLAEVAPIVPFEFDYQFIQPGWQLLYSTFHNTGATQSIGADVSCQINRLL